MGVNFVIIVENLAKRTQEEVGKELGGWELHGELHHNWVVFEFEGKSYASWLYSPRYFVLEEDEIRWEALRKYPVRVRRFFGNGKIGISNGFVMPKLPPEEGEENKYNIFYLPWSVSEDMLAEPDYEKHPELKDIKELEWLALQRHLFKSSTIYWGLTIFSMQYVAPRS